MQEIFYVTYVRESSGDVNKSPPISNQLEAGRQWGKGLGYKLFHDYADNGYSGGDWKRPAWNELIRHSRGHKFSIVWVWNQDRIARDTEQFLYFYRNMKASNIRIYSQTEGWIDMESLGDRVKHTSLAQASEIFRLVTGEKVKAAYRRKKERGERWGRPVEKVDESLLKRYREEGLGYRSIAKKFDNKISYQTIRRKIKCSE